MEVALERLPNAVAKVSVTIAPDDVQQAMDRAFKTVVRRYNIPGFRKGKAPRKIFEMYVGRGVLLQEAAQQLVDQHYGAALQQAAVEPVGEPRINIVTLEENQPFEFAIEVESKPAITVGPIDDLLTEPLSIPEPTPEDLDKELAQLAKSQAQLAPVEDEPVSMGDHVVLSLKGYLETEDGESTDAEPFVEDENYAVEVGSGLAVEGLENQLIGLKLGEPATIRLTYPESHPDVALAGKPVRFEVTVTDIKRPEIPPIDDELAQSLGYQSEQELRDNAANRLRERLEAQAKNDRLAVILGKLKERVTFDLPPTLVDRQIHRQLQELDTMLRRMGADLDQYLESRQMTWDALHEEMRPAAEERVKEQLILEALAKELDINVTNDDVLEAVRPIANLYQQSVDQVLQTFVRQGSIGALAEDLLISKVSDYLASTVRESSESNVGGENA